MSTLSLTPAQHAILTHALEHTGGRIEWFPDHIKGGARQKVLEGLANRALVARQGTDWVVAAEGYDALGVPRPSAGATRADTFAAKLDQIIAGAETAQARQADAEMEASVAAAEARWAQQQAAAQTPAPPRIRPDSKQARVIAMLRRPEGATVRQIAEATGWQPHTVRGTFAGALKKRLGLTIVSEKVPGGERTYRLA